MKKLLSTTDDFGMCHAVNVGIVQALTQGWCKSTNFLVPAPWFREAVDLALEHKLAVGLHACVTCDWDRLTWGPLSGNPRLKTPAGSLPSQHAGLAETGATDEDIYDELKAQLALVKKLYGQPTHIETHMVSGVARNPQQAATHRAVQALCAQQGLAYTYERKADGALRYFKDEDCQSGMSRAEVLERVGRWQADGAYHLFGHAAVASDELQQLCSPQHPARAWAADYRLSDMQLYLDKTLEADLEKAGFNIVGVAEALEA